MCRINSLLAISPAAAATTTRRRRKRKWWWRRLWWWWNNTFWNPYNYSFCSNCLGCERSLFCTYITKGDKTVLPCNYQDISLINNTQYYMLTYASRLIPTRKIQVLWHNSMHFDVTDRPLLHSSDSEEEWTILTASTVAGHILYRNLWFSYESSPRYSQYVWYITRAKVKSTVKKKSKQISDKFPMTEAETCCIDIAFQLPFKLYNYKG